MMMKNERIEVESLYQYQTAAISDVLDMKGINGGLEGILPIKDNSQVVGYAYTISFVQAENEDKAVAADYIDEVPEGSVIVIDNQGRTDCTVWGDILSLVSKLRNIKGTVINGCCRDVQKINEMDYQVFSKGKYMKSGKGRVKLKSVQIPIKFGKTEVKPGDIICGDSSGVIVIPKSEISETIETLQDLEKMENHVINDIKRGVPLKEARIKHNYNSFALKPSRSSK